jgi:hypothetical protein
MNRDTNDRSIAPQLGPLHEKVPIGQPNTPVIRMFLQQWLPYMRPSPDRLALHVTARCAK